MEIIFDLFTEISDKYNLSECHDMDNFELTYGTCNSYCFNIYNPDDNDKKYIIISIKGKIDDLMMDIQKLDKRLEYFNYKLNVSNIGKGIDDYKIIIMIIDGKGETC